MDDDISHDDELAMANGLLDMMTAERDTLKALCVDAVAVMEDVNRWLVLTGRESTAHQMHLAAFLTRARSILK